MTTISKTQLTPIRPQAGNSEVCSPEPTARPSVKRSASAADGSVAPRAGGAGGLVPRRGSSLSAAAPEKPKGAELGAMERAAVAETLACVLPYWPPGQARTDGFDQVLSAVRTLAPDHQCPALTQLALQVPVLDHQAAAVAALWTASKTLGQVRGSQELRDRLAVVVVDFADHTLRNEMVDFENHRLWGISAA